MERFAPSQEKPVISESFLSPKLSEALSKIEPNFEFLSDVEKMGLLRDLLDKWGQTVGDTTEPVDNRRRFVAEEAARLLTGLEANQANVEIS